MFPVFDLILYSIFLAMNYKIWNEAKPFVSYINFMMLGYFAGINMLVGITEVEFYYLVAYLLFRNFFTNWVMWKW